MNDPSGIAPATTIWHDLLNDEDIRERGRLLGVIAEKGRTVAGALANAEDVGWITGTVRTRRRGPGWDGFKKWFFGTKMKLLWLGLNQPLFLGVNGRIYRREVVNGSVFFQEAELWKRRVDGLKRVRGALKELGNQTH